MFYFLRQKYALLSPDHGLRLKSKLHDKYEVTDEGGNIFLSRKRLVGNSGILRIFFPKLVTKMNIGQNEVRFKTKMDAAATFFFIVFVGGVIVELTADRERYPREYPILLPVGLLVWYVANLVFE